MTSPSRSRSLKGRARPRVYKVYVGSRTMNEIARARRRRAEMRKARRSPIRRSRSPSSRSRTRSPTRGWARAAPRHGSERRAMLRHCGSKCFLDPVNRRYPICSHGSCSIDRRGVQSAYNRARQMGESKIASKARSILSRMSPSSKRRSMRRRR